MEGASFYAGKARLTFVLIDIDIARFGVSLEGIVITRFYTFTLFTLMTDDYLLSAIDFIQNFYPGKNEVETSTFYCRASELAQLTSCASIFKYFQFHSRRRFCNYIKRLLKGRHATFQ